MRSREIVVVWDVFVSYRHQQPDGPWVREVLVERLRAAGLRVLVDVDGFRLPGRQLHQAGERPGRAPGAGGQPAAAGGGHAGAVPAAAGHPGRLWLDMTSDEEVDRNLPRLVDELRAPPGVVA